MSMNDFEYALVQTGDASAGGIAIATVNVTPIHNKEANLEKYVSFIRKAGELGANLIVFPEQALQGYLWETEHTLTLSPEVFQYHYQNAETIPGEATAILRQYAKQYDLYIVMGLTEVSPTYAGGTGALFNSTALIGPGGVIGVYRKVHQPGAELHIYRAGNALDVYDTPLGRIGMLICYDVAFSETCLIYAIKGTDILVFSTAWTYSGPLTVNGITVEDYQGYLYDTFVKCRAAENQIWFVASDCAGRDCKMPWHFYGHSRIINPSGIVIAEIADEEGMAIAHGLKIKEEILAARTSYFAGLNILADRVPELYGAISDPNLIYPPDRQIDP
ncbi:MAG: carbon-nitrogen hydrolase family protein [Chloroflexi bacterium]|nr:carbon-nitrogen hydrolase family protein [Chloroflexota bacterium]MCL5075179.1 carbon-nitrogen hydrolase family protein [Chloroflexota bacterium]